MTRGDAYIGLMSGTSLDGISACVVRFTPRGGGGGIGFDYELLDFQVLQYTAEQRQRIRDAMIGGSARDYCRLGFDLGAWLAEAATRVFSEAGVPKGEIRAIGSHGQTLWHEAPHSTWQIGESAVLAERLGIDVVSDFRVRDVAAGGQGAPLVPVADALLFAGARWRALQNIGGIGNVTIVPPRRNSKGAPDGAPNGDSDDALSGVRAFDTGPGVAVIDGVVRTLRPELPFDRDGVIASAGNPVEEVVEELMAHPYFSAEPPKSTGRELFTPEYVAALVARCRELRDDCPDQDIVATATSLTSRSIAEAYRRFMPEPVEEVLVSGGGSKNLALMDMLSSAIAPITVRRFDEVYFDGEAKEAVAFALLAKLFIDGQPGNVPTATGSSGYRVLGKLTPR